MTDTSSFEQGTRDEGFIHRTYMHTSKDEICNRAGIRMHDTAASTAARPIQAHF